MPRLLADPPRLRGFRSSFLLLNFFAGRHFQSLDDLNAQATNWCLGVSADRRCPENTDLTVREAFVQEQSRLIALPDNPFDTREHKPVKAQKTPYIRFALTENPVMEGVLRHRRSEFELSLLSGQ
jgi:hypothetical protein